MTTDKIKRQYGLWDSPIKPISLARGISFSDVAWDQNGTLVWREGRSDRGVLVLQKSPDQAPRDFNSELSVRARVAYGGGDFTAGHGWVYFVEAQSGRLYRQPGDHGIPTPITPAFGDFASPRLSPDGNWLIFVHTCEDEDSVGIVDTRGRFWPQKLVSGDDFYMQPAWKPSNNEKQVALIAWIAWNHPNMPWNGTDLHLGKLDLSSQPLPTLSEVTTLAGGSSTSIFQPEFSPDGRFLAYASDASGWWQLYLFDLENHQHRQLTSNQADYALPAWTQGMRTYTFHPDGRSIFALRNQEGIARLIKIDVDSGEEDELSLGESYTWMEQIAPSPDGEHIALLASGHHTPARVITLDTSAGVWVRQRSTAEVLSPDQYASAQTITWRGMDDETVHGLFYSPHNPRFESSGKPPLVVNIHGGPTSQRRAAFNQEAQFFSTRGYAYLEVNYRGSTGYGRAYWEKLQGSWGMYDVQDAVSGARHLVDQGLVDSDRLVIMGGSAGGFTVLQGLEDYPGFFKAGICRYGVANQFSLVAETHKFESHYSDYLLGSLPEAADLYRERSPLFHAEKIQDPLIIFQGEDDKVVPRSQSDEIVASLQRRGVPHEYHLYPGEGHGFRKTETIEDYYQKIEKFLQRYVIYA